MRIKTLVVLSFMILIPALTAHAAVVVDNTDPDFARMTQAELQAMRNGDRGIVCQQLMERLDAAPSTTTIKALGPDEATWHPNDHRGTRSYVKALDTRVRGAERRKPTPALLYLHPSRIDPSMSLYRLGTFVHELSFAADLNDGKFSPDFRVRERRASFYRNGWLDSFHLKPIMISDRVATPEYAKAKELGLITADNKTRFPILDLPAAAAATTPAATP